MAKHQPWYRVVTEHGESDPMSRAVAELVIARTGGKIVPCLPPNLEKKKAEQLPLFEKPKGLH